MIINLKFRKKILA